LRSAAAQRRATFVAEGKAGAVDGHKDGGPSALAPVPAAPADAAP
jgi:hypothetical protein